MVKLNFILLFKKISSNCLEFRDGYARTDNNDRGLHVVCATMTREFLEYTKRMGNDLSTPR